MKTSRVRSGSAFSVNMMKNDMRIVGEDGAWTRASDWVYAMSQTYVLFDVNKRVTGEDLFQTPHGEKRHRLPHVQLAAGQYLY